MSDVSKTNEALIAEARVARTMFGEMTPLGNLLHRLANEVEAATRVPVQGEPNVDREVLDNVLIDAREAGDGLSAVRNRILAAGFSRATVPDAATAAIERVRAIIKPHIGWQLRRAAKFGRTKPDCGCEKCQINAALDGAPEPEWEEVVQYGNLTSLGFIQEIRGRNYAMHKRIVRFGPALPVDGEKP